MRTFVVTHLEPGDTLYLDMSNHYCTRNNHTTTERKLLIDFHGGKSFFFDGRYCCNCNRVYVDRNYYADTINTAGKHNLNVEIVCSDGSLLSEAEDEPSYEFASKDFPDRAEQSLLNKRGYNVGQTDDLPDWKRQEILRDIIDSGELTQGYICSHLKYLIKINGKKDANWLAVQKWQRDLDFVQNLGSTIMTLEDLMALEVEDDELPF